MLAMTAFVGCLAGFAGIALFMAKHARDLLGLANTSRKRLVCRTAGWALLALSTVLCVMQWGGSIGLVAWFGLATVAALLVAMALTYGAPSSKPRPARGKRGVPTPAPRRQARDEP